MSNHLKALVFNLRYEAKGIISVELRPASPDVYFPAFEAGSHIDLHLDNGLIRSYSLSNDSADQQKYVIGVLKDRNSRGGSSYVHDKLRVGQILEISAPRNNFPLDESATQSVLLAGGIGITPILSMLKRLLSLGRSVSLVYCTRSREESAYINEIEALKNDSVKVHYHFDQEAARPPNLEQLLSGFSADAHFYCCGPAPMLDAFEKACEKNGQKQVHLERFVAKQLTSPAKTCAYSVELRKTGRTIKVQEGANLLDALLDAGIMPSYSCKEGICGSCETKVVSGDVDHRDSILTKEEQVANKTMMICVSGCRSGSLVLEL